MTEQEEIDFILKTFKTLSLEDQETVLEVVRELLGAGSGFAALVPAS